MLTSLLWGIIAGFILAVPPGPVGVTAIKLSLNRGKRHGYLAGLGVSLMDLIFCLLAVFATSAMMGVIDDFSSKYPVGVLIFQFSIILAILVFGFITLKSKKKKSLDEFNEVKGFSFIEYLKSRGPFLLGFAVALANIANPTFLGSLSYISLQLQKWSLIEFTILGKLSYALGFGIGTFLWLAILVKLVVYYYPKLSAEMIVKLKKFAGLTLIGFGTVLGYRVIELTKWPEILRLLFAF